MKEHYVFYFAPHQDDELTNLGAAIVQDIDSGKQVFCVLCTDGSASGARRLIGNGKPCHLHQGIHPAGMDVPAFVAARDKEYRECCLQMGLKKEHTLLPENRARDSALTAEHASLLILEAIEGLPKEQVTVKTLLPVANVNQNPDHSAIGTAARLLWEKGAFAGLSLFFEFIHLEDGLLEGRKMTALRPENEAQKARLLSAAAVYGRWEPEAGYYAVGVHSVYDEFAAFVSDPYSLQADADEYRQI